MKIRNILLSAALILSASSLVSAEDISEPSILGAINSSNVSKMMEQEQSDVRGKLGSYSRLWDICSGSSITCNFWSIKYVGNGRYTVPYQTNSGARGTLSY